MTNISASLDGWQFAWQLAQREIRGSLRKFRVFLGALLVGVAAIGTVGSVAESMRDGINDNARILLGGDLEISSLHTPPNDEIIDAAAALGKVSQVIQMRAMLQDLHVVTIHFLHPRSQVREDGADCTESSGVDAESADEGGQISNIIRMNAHGRAEVVAALLHLSMIPSSRNQLRS